MKNCRFSIITVSYNSEDFIGTYVSSVLEHLPEDGELIILDNASQDQTVAELKKFLPKIKLLESSENLGFAKGNNKAVKEASGQYLLFLNPDTNIKQAVFNELIEFYESRSDVGIVAPQLIEPNKQIQPSVKKLPTILGATKEYILGIKNAYSQYVPKTDKPIEVEAVYGAVMLIRKDIFESIGGFNEKFFMYYEDTDLCKKIRSFGKKIFYYPGVKIEHLVGGTKSERDKYELNYESFIKYHGRLKAVAFQMIFLLPRLRRRLGLS